MCGLAGVVYRDGSRPTDRAMLAGMAGLLRHRGPDSEGFFDAPGIGFAFRRLSIIDLEGGDQPISNEDGTVTVMCNGEIYNFVELRADLEARGHRFRTKSDVEVIVHLYEEHGTDCLRFLRGMFGFALWDSRERRLMLARDRFGIKPLHYAETPQGLYFASEQKPILAFAEGLDRTPDAQAFKSMLSFGYIVGAHTPCRGIRRLPSGHFLLYQDGRLSLQAYWNPHFPSRDERPPRMSADDWAEGLLEALRESVRLHMRSDVPVGAWLSPGIDSSAVTALAGELSDDPIRGFTLGFEAEEADELRHSPTLDHYGDYNLRTEVTVCRQVDFALFEKAMWHCEEPGGVIIPRMLMSSSAAKQVKVVLGGEGSDEMFGGYNFFRRQKSLGRLSHLPLWMRKLMLCFGAPLSARLRHQQVRDLIMLPPAMGMRRYAALYGVHAGQRRYELLVPALRSEPDAIDADQPPIAPPPGYASWDPFLQQQFLEQTIRMPEQINQAADRLSMAHGLEVRVPFLDHVFAEYCARIPVDLKLRGGTEKYILRHALRDVLPPEILWRRKRGLQAPSISWWRMDKLPEFVVSRLSESALRHTGYFEPKAVHDLLARHRSGAVTYDRQLNAVLAMQIRAEQFQQSRLVAQSGVNNWRPSPE